MSVAISYTSGRWVLPSFSWWTRIRRSCLHVGCLFNSAGVIQYSKDQKSCFIFEHYDGEFSAGYDRSLFCVGNGQPNLGLRPKGVFGGGYCTWVANGRRAQEAALIANDDGETYTYATPASEFCGENIGRDSEGDTSSASQGGKEDKKFTITPCVCW